MQKIKIKNILKKKGKTPIVCLTAYSKSVAEILDKYCDIILVGDSVGMSLYGMQSTKQIKLDTMILHAKAVRKFAKRSLVVFDMPYRTYVNKFQAYKNAKKVLKITGCDAIKLEGGEKIASVIKYLTYKKIPACAAGSPPTRLRCRPHPGSSGTGSFPCHHPSPKPYPCRPSHRTPSSIASRSVPRPHTPRKIAQRRFGP